MRPKLSDAKTLWDTLTHSLDGCIEDLPADLDYCETDCRDKDCSGDAFASCPRRLERARQHCLAESAAQAPCVGTEPGQSS